MPILINKLLLIHSRVSYHTYQLTFLLCARSAMRATRSICIAFTYAAFSSSPTLSPVRASLISTPRLLTGIGTANSTASVAAMSICSTCSPLNSTPTDHNASIEHDKLTWSETHTILNSLHSIKLGMCGMDFSSSVRFRFSVEKPSVWFGFLCRSVVKYKKTCKLCFMCVHFAFWATVFLNAQLVSNACFLKFNLNFNFNHIVFVYMMPIMSLSCVRNVRTLKLCENGSNIDYLYETSKFGFEKSHGNRNFGFDLLVSVRVFKNQNRTEIQFPHIPS